MATHWETLEIDGSRMRTLVAEPDAAGPHPGVVVVMGRTGIDDALQEQAADLAAHGFVAVAPDMFHREDSHSPEYETANTRVQDVLIETDVNAVIRYLEAHPGADAKHIGIVGFCMGGRISYLMATRRPDLKAAAVFYGGGIMKPRGKGPAPFEQSANINCPILGLFGLEDENPSPADVAKIDGELTRLGKVHEFHSYPNAGHAFMGKGRPSYREHAAKDAWPKTLQWFDTYLRKGAERSAKAG